MAEEKEADYGSAKREGRLRGMSARALKKSTQEGEVLTAEDEVKTSTQTPDPNVTGAGNTSDSTSIVSGTVTGRANTTTSSPTAPAKATKSTTGRSTTSTSTTDGT